MERIYVRMLGEAVGRKRGAPNIAVKPELIEVDGRDEAGLVEDMVREHVLMCVEVDSFGGRIYTVEGWD